MNFLEIIQNRYTTKEYDPNFTISSSQLSQLKEILHLAPSSINSQPWKFVFVENKVVKASLAKYSLFNEPKVENCSLVVVFMAQNSVENYEKWMKENLDERVNGYYFANVKNGGDEQVLAWFQKQLYLSLGVFLSGCAAMGLDSTPMEGIDTAGYDSVVATEGYKTLFAVAVGGRDANDFNQLDKKPKQRKSSDEVIITL